jgi:hypothetical protein
MTDLVTSEPLIHTSLGNLPVSSLERRYGWSFTSCSITYWEKYYLDGKPVREDSGVFGIPVGTKLELSGGTIG